MCSPSLSPVAVRSEASSPEPEVQETPSIQAQAKEPEPILRRPRAVVVEDLGAPSPSTKAVEERSRATAPTVEDIALVTETRSAPPKPMFKERGCAFRGLEPVPFHPDLDPAPGACFKCWVFGHDQRNCSVKKVWEWCLNCGRRYVTASYCPRCGKAYCEWQRRCLRDRSRSVIRSAATPYSRPTEGSQSRRPQMAGAQEIRPTGPVHSEEVRPVVSTSGCATSSPGMCPSALDRPRQVAAPPAQEESKPPTTNLRGGPLEEPPQDLEKKREWRIKRLVKLTKSAEQFVMSRYKAKKPSADRWLEHLSRLAPETQDFVVSLEQ